MTITGQIDLIKDDLIVINYLPCQVFNLSLLDGLKVGDFVEATLSITGVKREDYEAVIELRSIKQKLI